MNWTVVRRTSAKVGYGQDGDDYEGGCCDHLKEGDKAFGESVENDDWGSESYLMCEACYKEALESHKTEPTDCMNCGHEFPKNEMQSYTPYDPGEPGPMIKFRRYICVTCFNGEEHQRRLKRDQEDLEEDLKRIEEYDDFEEDFEEDFED